MRIIVADDDELMLKTIEFRLKKDGHTVFIAHDGREALQKINELTPDLVITDIMMPFSSGLEIVSAVKQKYKTGVTTFEWRKKLSPAALT